MKKSILIIDRCGYNSQLLARTIRDERVYCEIVTKSDAFSKIGDCKPLGVIVNYGTEPTDTKFNGELRTLGVPSFVNTVDTSDSELKSFLFDTCSCPRNWTMSDYAEETIAALKEQIGDGSVLLGLSGGIDSSVCAALLSKAVGSRLTCILVDHGLMRKNEADEVVAAFAAYSDMRLIRINAQERFLTKLAGVADPEKKRKIIGEEFIRVFEEEAKKLGRIDYLAQGTIYPDVIESGMEGAKAVKAHHNVGGLPELIDFKEIVEPVRPLFKYEVRELGALLGLPEELVWRQAFPGPGIGVRCLGAVTKERLDILRDADAIFREEIAAAGLHKDISQYFAVLPDMRSVGVRNDARSFEYTVALRAIVTVDYMTAKCAELPFALLQKTMKRITAEVEGVSRVVFDLTDKPPATIEWE